MKSIKQTLIQKVNSSDWWHVPPRDTDAYKKRGKFLASTYTQAEFYGKPNMFPERVSISNPIFGYSETQILKQLFPMSYKKLGASIIKMEEADEWYKQRIYLDAKMAQKAKGLRYDAIILLPSNAKKDLLHGKKPNSIELNILNT